MATLMPSRYTLPNGLTVVFEEQHTSRVAAFQVWVNVGSADENEDQVGLAHLHEHMLFKGTARRGLGEIACSIEAHGGEINAWTSFDHTVYHVVMASQYAREGLDVLADALRASAFEADELRREIEVVCEEIKRSLDMPSRRASKELFASAFTKHPYGRPVIGYESNVRAHHRDGVLQFYRAHYRPPRMVLSAVGDFSEAQLRGWVDEFFGGDWGPTNGARPHRPVEPAFEQLRINLHRDEVKEAHLHLGFQLPGVDHVDTPALDVLAMLLGQGDASRLALEVRRKRSLAKEASAWAWTPRDRGLFAVALVTDPHQLGAAFEETVRVLSTATAAEVEPDELATVKALIEAEAVYKRETVQGLARKLGYYQAAAGGIEREATYFEAVSAVTPALLREVADRYLTFDKAVLTGLLPSECDFAEGPARQILLSARSRRPGSAPRRSLPPPYPIRLTSTAKTQRPQVVQAQLACGATVLVREERAVPLFAVRASFPGGLRFEHADDNGLTALLSRSITRGTPTMDAEQISHLLDRLAGGLSAVAGRSSFTLRGEFLSKHFDKAFDVVAEVLGQPTFPEPEVARERRLLLHDVAARDDRPSSVVFELLAKTLFSIHPYRMSPIGERASLERLTPDSLRRYHARYLDPSQMTLVLVGDVDADVVIERATAAFGKSRGGAATPTPIPPEPPWTGPREARRTLSKAQTHLALGFVGARVTDPWRRALEVISTLLSGQSGRLFLELRDKRSLAYSVSCLSVEGVDPGTFAVYMATSPEKVPAALEGMRGELARLQQDLVSETELGRAREHLIGTHEISLQRNGSRASVMALDSCYGLGAERYLRYPEEICAVTAEEVRQVARRVLDLDRSAFVVVGP